MYNVELVVREDCMVIRRVVLNKSPMHKRPATSWAKRKAKELNVAYDDGSWRNYQCVKWPRNSVVEVTEI